ncbi:ATPase [Mangrovactinospora gilvigrisea]|uniref:ATPase n=1 Tax=Mangrovactinospora gilvigrisea TaxID=1428644 RepID=A0A1J7BIZ4_9ACTN|nr:ATPase [Mangrovactinospora gilvigrisea]OIV38643.1 ATPase [Mangrovactinospora gilvigrisea]
MDTPVKPARVQHRDREWAMLAEFAARAGDSLRIAVVSGRRRYGKSFLLQALTEAMGGLYITAVQEDGARAAKDRIAQALASHSGLPTDALRIEDWDQLLRTVFQVAGRGPGAPLVVIDEFPYLLQHSPEIPGLLQRIYDEGQFGTADAPRGALVLCGSALSVMHELLSGQKPLRGRALIDMRLGPFDYRQARAYWQIPDAHTAFLVDACLGGAPGYARLTDTEPPHSPEEFAAWAVRVLLSPDRATYTRTETGYLLREDPRIRQRTTYYELLTAIADGATTPTAIGAAAGRERTALTHTLEVLETAGYARRDQDVLKQRNPIITLPDPVIRFNQVVTLPQAPLIDLGQPERAWSNANHAFHSKVVGPHFEQLARAHAATHLLTERPELPIGHTGSTEVPDPAKRTQHEVDVLALAPGESPRKAHRSITVIGEAKATAAPRAIADLDRLARIRDLLTAQGHRTEHALLVLYSLAGFWPDLEQHAAKRPDVLLVDLAALYGDGPLRGGGAS